jgi:hypothetical protein
MFINKSLVRLEHCHLEHCHDVQPGLWQLTSDSIA